MVWPPRLPREFGPRARPGHREAPRDVGFFRDRVHRGSAWTIGRLLYARAPKGSPVQSRSVSIAADVFQDADDFMGGERFGPKNVHTKEGADHSLTYLSRSRSLTATSSRPSSNLAGLRSQMSESCSKRSPHATRPRSPFGSRVASRSPTRS